MALYRVSFFGEAYVEADSAEEAWMNADVVSAEISLDEVEEVEK